MRKVKKNISVDIDSALSVMQEIYNDIAENRNTANLIMKKMLSFMKDSEDMTMIGPIIKEQQKILNDCTEKKISLVKLQSGLLKLTNGGTGPQQMGKLELTDDDRKMLEELMKEDSEGETENYKM